MSYQFNGYGPFRLELTKENLEMLCSESRSINEVIIKSGRRMAGGTYKHIADKIRKYDIDISHFVGKGWTKAAKEDTNSYRYASLKRGIEKNTKYNTDSDIFVIDPTIQRRDVRNYILKHNSIPYVCKRCGNTGIWEGEELALELDHINGVNFDHRYENLRFLCPNCHAITKTFAGRNRSKEHSEKLRRVEKAYLAGKEPNKEDMDIFNISE